MATMITELFVLFILLAELINVYPISKHSDKYDAYLKAAISYLKEPIEHTKAKINNDVNMLIDLALPNVILRFSFPITYIFLIDETILY